MAGAGEQRPVQLFDDEEENIGEPLENIQEVDDSDVEGESAGEESEQPSSTGESESSEAEESSSELHPNNNRESAEMGNRQSDQPGTSDDRLDRRKRRRNFDTTLAAAHQYLGADDDLAGAQSMHDEDDVINNVPIFPVRHVVLMPGQTLPLHSLHPRAVQMFRNIIAHQKTFAVVNKRYTLDSQLADVCTLAQILSYKDCEEDEMSVIKLKAVGRQRAQLLETTNCLDGTTVGKVRILPEITLLPSLHASTPASLCRFALSPTKRLRTSAYKVSKYQSAILTPVPWFVHRQYDLHHIVDQVSDILGTWYDPARIQLAAQRPREFSFWVASVLPVNDEQKVQLLAVDCDQKRLLTELQLLKKCDQLRCAFCSTLLSERRAIFSMSTDGPMAAYVNTGGYVHEMITVLAAHNLHLIGTASTANSWFPGYAWTIANCAECGSHLGWKFTAVKRQLKPHKFFGITRSAIRAGMSGGREEESSADTTGGPTGPPMINRRWTRDQLLEFLQAVNGRIGHANVDEIMDDEEGAG